MMAGLLYCLPLTSPWLQPKEPDNQSTFTDCVHRLSQVTCPLLLLGEASCGKTMLLFQAAVAYASQDFHVTFISRQPLTQMPHPVHGMTRPETAGLLKTLTFLYMNNVQDVMKLCSEIHTRTLLPDVLIVDDFEYYLSQTTEPSPEVGSAKLSALLQDTAAYIRNKRSGHCVLMLGCRSGAVYTPQLFSRLGYAIANITAAESKTKLFHMDLKADKVGLKLGYSLEDVGLFLTDVSFVT